MLKLIRADEINTSKKARVLFCSHPDDFNQYFETVSKDIHSLNNCDIYYYENGILSISDDWESDCFAINLIVIAISDKFLSEDNYARRVYFFAQDKSIPVLPIMMERNLEQKFNSVCGQIQFLDRTNDDPTSLPYMKKLEDYLSAILVGNELADKVRAMFDRHIFLSYRKKDRKYAQKLMAEIHGNKETEDVAIWYDEFLQPNENFDESIRSAISKSDLFTLAVTPNIANENNYVVSNEIPTAIEENKIILPVELVDTDKTLFENYEVLKSLPETVSITDTETFTETLIKALSHVARQEHGNDPMHMYYLGIAYLYGIDVEINKNKAVRLLESAAEKGAADAAKELVRLFYYGFHLKSDYTSAVRWQKKLIKIHIEQLKNNDSDLLKLELANELRFLTEIERNTADETDSIDNMIAYCEKSIEICNRIKIRDGKKTIADEETISRVIDCKLESSRSLAILYELSGNFTKALAAYAVAIELQKSITESDTAIDFDTKDLTLLSNNYRLANLYYDIGIMYQKEGDYKSAIDEMLKSLEIYQTMSKTTSAFLSYEAGVHGSLAHAASFVDVELSEKHSVIAVEICEKLYAENQESYELNYARSLLDRAYVLTELGSSDLDEIEDLCLKSEEIYEKHINEKAYIILINYVNVLYKLAGVYRKKYILDKASLYYNKAISYEPVFSSSNIINESGLTFAHLFFDYATFLAIEPSLERLVKAKEYLEKALSLFKSSGSLGQKYIDETKEVITNIQSWLSNYSDESTAEETESDDVKKAFMNFQFYYFKGDEAEKEENYEKAHRMYESAWKQLMIIEDIKGEVGVVEKTDILDRLAVSCEMTKELRLAKLYYTTAADMAYDKAIENPETEYIDLCKWLLKKVIDFCGDYGYEVGARIYREKLSEITRLTAHEDDIEETIDLPDGKGNIVPFRVLDVIEYKQKQYAILGPASMVLINRDSLLILQLKTNFKGELTHVGVIKPSLIEKIYEAFKSSNTDRYNFAD